MGKSVNEASPELLKQAEAMLTKQKPNIKAFHEDNGQDLLLSGEVDLAMEYNGDIAQIMKEDDDIDFVVPKEGAMKQQDTLAIPVGARIRKTPSSSSTSSWMQTRGRRSSPPSSTRPERRRRRADAGGVQEQSGDLPARGYHGEMRVSELSRAGLHAPPR